MKKPRPGYIGPFDGEFVNSQPIEKQELTDGGILHVHSIFHTIQGEGPFSGSPAVFIRLAGCNLQCPLCDTEYTLGRKPLTPTEIVAKVNAFPIHTGGLVVITGGEPFRQNLLNLFRELVDAGYYVQVETNGTLPPPKLEIGYSLSPAERCGVYIVCSPKTGKINDDIRSRVCCFKYVLSAEAIDEEDGLPTSVLGLPRPPARPSKGRDGKWTCPVYIQPADHQNLTANDDNYKAVVASAMRFNYIVQLQIHKPLNLE